jgi:hypothetical protein
MNANSQVTAEPTEKLFKKIIWQLFAGESHQVVKITVTQPKRETGSRKYDPGCSSRIRILVFYLSRIQGVKNGSATLIMIL